MTEIVKRLLTRRIWVLLLAADVIICVLFFALKPGEEPAPTERRISDSGIKRICELATLECFYHNVTEWSEDSNWLGYGKKKFWLEYDGTVRIGIQGGQVKISEPDLNGVVTVVIPPAAILDKDLDESSIKEIDSSSPMWGFIPFYDSIETEERREALAKAQEDMEKSASRNGMLLIEAQDRAKKIIEKNIIALGEAVGKHYTVRFVDAVDDAPSAESAQ